MVSKEDVMCKRKKAYKSNIDALIAASRTFKYKDSESGYFRAYKCPYCNKYHLTKQKDEN